ncbi:MAG TPA: hypothetical protein DCE44_19205 [Verrucomicrobiales bacterium]|nr:hypothetical protein [Verrucomicrobiales bacterium]
MNPAAGDNELVRTYAREGSETAFQALVARHVNLVYGAAFRQVGDSGIAEEITQNVFVALARKAPRLAGHETLAGWLHRTAILESKARIRAELRRQRRESTAAALAQLEQAGSSPSNQADDLALLLDEGLLNLRDPDRLALVLRYLEERSLREVGTVLGVDEEAARKRVSRALERLTNFFRGRGFAVPTAGGAAVLTQAVQAVPSGLVAAATNAGLAAGSAATGFNLILINIMALTKTQTALVCALLVGLPLVWQWRTYQVEAKTNAALSNQFHELEQELAGADTEARRLQDSLVKARADSLNAEGRFVSLQSRKDSWPKSARYQWDDRSPVARVPKELLHKLSLVGVTNRQGQLSAEIKAALQLTPEEATAVQASVDRFLADFQATQADAMRPVTPRAQDLNGHAPQDVRVFEITGVKDRVRELRDAFLLDLNSVLDPERAELFARSLKDWIQGEQASGINTGMTIFSADHRLRFYQEPGLSADPPRLGWGLSSEQSTMNASIPVDEIPTFLRPYLQDWIDAARRGSPAVPPLPPPSSNQP